jgi:hypothetical protein
MRKKKKKKKEKRNGEPKNQQGEMVDNQTVNKTNKHLKKRKKRENSPQFRNSSISVLVVLVLLFQYPVLFVCVS